MIIQTGNSLANKQTCLITIDDINNAQIICDSLKYTAIEVVLTKVEKNSAKLFINSPLNVIYKFGENSISTKQNCEHKSLRLHRRSGQRIRFYLGDSATVNDVKLLSSNPIILTVENEQIRIQAPECWKIVSAERDKTVLSPNPYKIPEEVIYIKESIRKLEIKGDQVALRGFLNKSREILNNLSKIWLSDTVLEEINSTLRVIELKLSCFDKGEGGSVQEEFVNGILKSFSFHDLLNELIHETGVPSIPLVPCQKCSSDAKYVKQISGRNKKFIVSCSNCDSTIGAENSSRQKHHVALQWFRQNTNEEFKELEMPFKLPKTKEAKLERLQLMEVYLNTLLRHQLTKQNPDETVNFNISLLRTWCELARIVL